MLWPLKPRLPIEGRLMLTVERRAATGPVGRDQLKETRMAADHDVEEGSQPSKGPLSPVAGAGMGIGVGAALTAATGDGWWIGAFAGLGAAVALALSAFGCQRWTWVRKAPASAFERST